jgi:hypothetical protein
MTPTIKETLRNLGYSDPDSLIRSRTQEDQEFLQSLVQDLAKSEMKYEVLKDEIRALRDSILELSKEDPFEMQDAVKKWREIYELEANTSRVDLHQIIDREDNSYSVHDGKMIRTITTYYADGTSSIQSFSEGL